MLSSQTIQQRKAVNKNGEMKRENEKIGECKQRTKRSATFSFACSSTVGVSLLSPQSLVFPSFFPFLLPYHAPGTRGTNAPAD